MARGVHVVSRKPDNKRQAKVKTGCETCRIRKIKCDEERPFCQKCVKTGRTCDGYDPFRFFSTPPINVTHNVGIKSDVCLPHLQPATEITPREIDLLSRYFSTKTLFDIKLDCDEEARQVLQASLTDAPVRHAVMSLRILRDDLEASGDGPASTSQPSTSYQYGLQQYNMALRGTMSTLSSPGSSGLHSALLCCQIFISIEQVRKNYAAMGQHIIRGLKIMKEYLARPELVAADRLVTSRHDPLPLLDVFIIKLFAAPCKFADLSATTNANESTTPVCPVPPEPFDSRHLRTIIPDMRTGITRIAASTLEFLDKVSRVDSVGIALQLLSEKAALLALLESWLMNLNLVYAEIGSEPIPVSFMRFFHSILRVVLLGALESSPGLTSQLQSENDRLQSLADNFAKFGTLKAHIMQE
ncbi:putative transcriptional regulatory protein [Lachnellula suecica]|uniref:Putative transcriptional regulatory protein n=1 Tax=Lachnellula suecica TaxID=602035 RepID=A0A8T9CBT5_9HELO|nr:putative transcriptional regulatory protein [Lachnellula suecica]